MGYVYYRLNNAANLQGMAPPALVGGAFGNAALPAGMAGVAGMYIIINSHGVVENRYIGISSNIGNRFNTRMATVTEMGIDAVTLGNIHVVWGTVKISERSARRRPPAWPLVPQIGGGNVQIPTWGTAGWTVAAPAAGPFVRMIDGGVVNLEHLLIRFVMTQMGAGGTVSNNMLMAPFIRPAFPGVTPLIVMFESAAFGNYNAFAGAEVLNPGGAW